MNSRFTLICAFLACCSCTPSAYLKSETPDSGHVQVVGPGCLAPIGMTKAEEVMAKKCPQGYEKIKSGEESSGGTIGGPMASAEIPARFVDFKCVGNLKKESK
jgi:hypothetical protein